jgi:hypothetical protein
MRKAILIFLSALASSNAMAEWVAVGRSDADILYVDPETIQWLGNNTAKLWALNDFKVAQRLNERELYKSEKAQYEYDCKLVRSRLLYFTSHTENMAEGEIVDFNVAPGDWARVTPNSRLDELWKIACGKV